MAFSRGIFLIQPLQEKKAPQNPFCSGVLFIHTSFSLVYKIFSVYQELNFIEKFYYGWRNEDRW